MTLLFVTLVTPGDPRHHRGVPARDLRGREQRRGAHRAGAAEAEGQVCEEARRRGRKGLIGRPARHQGGTREAGKGESAGPLKSSSASAGPS